MKYYTNRGGTWEALQCSWLLLFILPDWHWLAWVYISVRIWCRSWMIFAAIYATPGVTWMLFGQDFPPALQPYFGNWYWISYFVAAVHALFVRRDFLLRLDARIRAKEQTELSAFEIESAPAIEGSGSALPDLLKPAEEDHLDLNSCHEDQLAQLPNFTPDRAAVAIYERSRAAFSSVDDFVARMRLKPHEIAAIKALVTVAPSSTSDPTPERRSPGRIVDY